MGNSQNVPFRTVLWAYALIRPRDPEWGQNYGVSPWRGRHPLRKGHQSRLRSQSQALLLNYLWWTREDSDSPENAHRYSPDAPVVCHGKAFPINPTHSPIYFGEIDGFARLKTRFADWGFPDRDFGKKRDSLSGKIHQERFRITNGRYPGLRAGQTFYFTLSLSLSLSLSFPTVEWNPGTGKSIA